MERHDVEHRAARLLLQRDPTEVTAEMCGAGVVLARAFCRVCPGDGHERVSQSWLESLGFYAPVEDGDDPEPGCLILYQTGTDEPLLQLVEQHDGSWTAELGAGDNIKGNWPVDIRYRQQVYDLARMLGEDLTRDS